jgi:hypothetical protein
MSDYRDPNDPYGNMSYEPADSRSTTWGWIAGAIFVVIILALAFGVNREPNRIASNDAAPPTVSHMTPPTQMNPATPGLTPPAVATPNAAAPNKP